VDILRGSRRTDLLRLGYHNIKTYGAGMEHRFEVWQYFIAQMIHLGYLELAYDAGNVLHVTDLGKGVLFDGKKVTLVIPVDKTASPTTDQPGPASKGITAKAAKAIVAAAPNPNNKVATKEQAKREVSDALTQLRRQLSQRTGIPPYLIFSDTEIDQIATLMPFTPKRLLDVPGMTKAKVEQFGTDVINMTGAYIVAAESKNPLTIIGKTYLLSYDLHQKGLSVEEISQGRGMSPVTIEGHLAECYAEGLELDLDLWVKPEVVDRISGALHMFPKPYVLRTIEEHFEGAYTMNEIRWVISNVQRMETFQT
jgi:ATP-dependent DNA helicase RecQ